MNSFSSPRRGPKPNLNTRDNLIRAGLKTFHAQGFAATGLQTIVAEASVPKGSFYNHFESKEAFGVEVIDAYSRLAEENLRAFLLNPELPTLERLEAFFDDRIASLTAGGYGRGCLMGNFSAEAADHSALIREHLEKNWNTWSQIFESCIAEGQLEGTITNRLPAVLLARFMFNSWEGALLRMRVEKSGAALAEFKTVVLGALLCP
ncbi:TetR family transcriptional regulator C-terminal domain-containing protein [Undibacterium sp. TJN25]|uniref:TetR/AcrR family transcriptional regulator n=1 Tax=Undibacterium sp. TJN25 TaxID=3413056 RepID=UPI003BF301BA